MHERLLYSSRYSVAHLSNHESKAKVDEMSAERVEPTTNVRLVLGPFEITCTNLTKDQLASALKDFLSVAESSYEEVSRLNNKFAGLTSHIAGLLKPGPAGSKVGTLSITELVRKAQRKKGTDIALVIAYYLFKQRGLEVINTKDLGDAYDEARLPKLTNPTDTLNKLVTAGKMKAAGEKEGLKGYTITQTGEEEVEGWLSPDN